MRVKWWWHRPNWWRWSIKDPYHASIYDYAPEYPWLVALWKKVNNR